MNASRIEEGQPIFVHWEGIKNESNQDITNELRYVLYLNGEHLSESVATGLPADFRRRHYNIPLPLLSAGTYTLTLAADILGAVEEQNERDNTYSRTFRIEPRRDIFLEKAVTVADEFSPIELIDPLRRQVTLPAASSQGIFRTTSEIPFQLQITSDEDATATIEAERVRAE